MHTVVHFNADELTLDFMNPPRESGARSYTSTGRSIFIVADNPSQLRELAQRLALRAEEWEQDMAAIGPHPIEVS